MSDFCLFCVCSFDLINSKEKISGSKGQVIICLWMYACVCLYLSIVCSFYRTNPTQLNLTAGSRPIAKVNSFLLLLLLSMSVKVYTIFSVDNNDQTSGKKHHRGQYKSHTKHPFMCMLRNK